MKKLLAAFLLLSPIGIYASKGLGFVSGHTTFSAINPFQGRMPVVVAGFRNDRMEKAECGWGGAAQVVIFGGESFDKSSLAEFFLPFGRSSLRAVEFKQPFATLDNDPNFPKDIEARNFNIVTNVSTTTTFQSELRFCPKQTIFGIGFNYKQAITEKCNGIIGFWFEALTSVQRIKNTMGMHETIITDGGGVALGVDGEPLIGLDGAPVVANMTEAFAQPNWKFGKIIAGCDMDKWGLADIELRIGYNTLECETCHLNSYVGIIVPTGNKPCPEFVFAPVVGNNKHFGVSFGNNYGFTVLERGCHSLHSEIDTDGRFLFRNHQVRSFDLIDKQWSRYLALYDNQEAAIEASLSEDAFSGTSGINVFTGCFKVSPRFSFNINTALIYRHECGFEAEVGYNLFARQAEEVCLKSWNPEPQVKSVLGLGFTNIAKTIRYNFIGSDIAAADFTPIPASELNIDSAAHPAVLSNIIYGNLTYNWDDLCHPVFVSVGGDYEFSSINTSLQRWLVWGKFGISF